MNACLQLGKTTGRGWCKTMQDGDFELDKQMPLSLSRNRGGQKV